MKLPPGDPRLLYSAVEIKDPNGVSVCRLPDQAPTASFTHFLLKLDLAAPASFFSLLAISHFFINEASLLRRLHKRATFETAQEPAFCMINLPKLTIFTI